MESKNKLFENRHLSVFNLEIEAKDRKLSYTYIERKDGVLVMGIKNGKLIMIKQYRPIVNRHTWEFPGGGITNNSNLLQDARCELVEESGYDGTNWRIFKKLFVSPGTSNQSIYIVTTDIADANMVSDGDELELELSAEFFSLEEIQEMIVGGDIIDVETIMAFYLYKESLT